QTALDGYMTSMEFSSTGDFLAFASSSGTVSLWTDKDDPEVPQVNAYERDSITVDLLPEIIQVSDDAPLSSVGMPYYTEQLLSATWPGDLFFDITCPPQRIPKEVLAQVKMSDFVGYAKNPGIGFRRNQSSKSILLQMQNQANLEGEMPKFRSEQERESLIGKGGKKGIAAFGNSPILESSGSFGIIPKPYRRVQIKYSKFGIEDFDFAFFNKSAATRSGLETHIKNSYTNSLLQLLFYTQPLRRIAAAHISTMCVKLQSVCMLCELGFLFRMLEEAKGANCQAGNFLHAFGKVVQAGALGLFEQDLHTAAVPTTGGASSIVPQQDVVAMIQGFHRFILETLSGEGGAGVPGFIKDVNETDGGGVTLVQQAMGLRWRNVSRCNGCGVEEDKDTVTFNDNILNVPSFPTLLNATLQKEASSKAWCIHCNKFNNLFQSKCLHDLPNLIAINLKMVLHEAVIGDPAMETWIPHRFVLTALSVFDILFIMDEQDCTRDHRGKGAPSFSFTWYAVTLRTPSHPYLIFPVDSESEWLLFNDFSVQPIASNDVSRFETWKSPSILQYTRVDLETRVDYTTLTTAGTLEHLLIHNPLSNSRRDLLINYTPLTDAELPIKPGFVVAIDAEFVALQKAQTEIRSDGSRSTILPSKMGLARVSVLRGYDGPMAGVPFIDDYIEVQDDIVDYLTEYSGISAGNLDPSTSIHPLVTLKVAYQKLRYLVDCGCVFVGHGLKKDFRTINIIIPPEQIIDTVDIYFIKERQRKLSLRFLAWSVLRQEIQQDTHDSIEDARTALLLYKRYLELSRQGIFQQVLEDVYEEGKQFNFKPPTSGGFS
ncbi:ubiquitin carboxyl-terminal hydrolase-domain-containing protein, partial [Chytriomyces sp. MP71]